MKIEHESVFLWDFSLIGQSQSLCYSSVSIASFGNACISWVVTDSASAITGAGSRSRCISYSAHLRNHVACAFHPHCSFYTFLLACSLPTWLVELPLDSAWIFLCDFVQVGCSLPGDHLLQQGLCCLTARLQLWGDVQLPLLLASAPMCSLSNP